MKGMAQDNIYYLKTETGKYLIYAKKIFGIPTSCIGQKENAHMFNSKKEVLSFIKKNLQSTKDLIIVKENRPR